MSFNFTEEFKLNGAGGGVFTFYKKGFKLGGVTSPSFIDVILSGVSPLTLERAISLNYVKLFGGTEQRNLPVGYTQVEYLEVTAEGVYFLTGINATVDTDMGITASNITSNSAQILVAQCISGGDYVRVAKASATQRLIGNFGSSSVTDTNTDGVTKFTARVNKSGFYVNGSLIGTFSDIPSSFTGVGEVDIFRGKYSDTSYYAYNGSRFYSAWVDDNIFLPCRRNSDNQLGIYNTKTGQFILPEGTGTFTAGADVIPTPDTPMDIVCNNGKIKAGNIYNVDTMGTVLDVSLANTKGDNKIFWNSSSTSVMMPCLPNTTYTASLNGTLGGTIFRIASVDRQLTNADTEGYEVSAINRTPVDNTLTITTGPNDAYIYVQFSSAAIENMKQILQITIQGQIYIDGTVETVEITGKNLFDVSTMLVSGSFVRAGGTTEEKPLGSLTSNGAYSCSDYIKVLPNTSYATTIPGYLEAGGAGLVYFTTNSETGAISGVTLAQQGGTTYTFTTPATCNYIRFSWYNANGDNAQLELGSTATTYEQYFNGGSATAENLLKVGTYKDEQSILDGGVTRNVGIKVLDGSEDWTYYSNQSYSQFSCTDVVADVGGASGVGFCTHFKLQYTNQLGSFYFKKSAPNNLYIIIEPSYNLTTFKQWLADQYQAGHPVIVVYPLATPTTESVTEQPMSIQTGTNIVTITQASIDDLEMEVSFKQSL